VLYIHSDKLWAACTFMQGHGEMVELLLALGATASDLPAPQGKVRLGWRAGKQWSMSSCC
jgi:hypothetical protein